MRERRLACCVCVVLGRQVQAGLRVLIPLLLVGGLSGFISGCSSASMYQPNAEIVKTMGVEQAKQRLKETTLRSINPQIVEADVTDEFLRYRYRQAIAGFQTGAILENQIAFLNAVQVQVNTDNVVNVRTSAGVLIAQLVFGNEQDAKTFADLLASFRQQNVR
jgi:hypothetical protein